MHSFCTNLHKCVLIFFSFPQFFESALRNLTRTICFLQEWSRHFRRILSLVSSYNYPSLCLSVCTKLTICFVWSKIRRIRDRQLLTSALDVTPFYLRTAQATSGLVVDYRNWQIPLGRRFRSLKIWYVLRSFGTNGFRSHLRKLVDLAKYFEEMVKSEDGVEMFTPRSFSLVVFRILDPSKNLEIENKLNAAFIKRSNEEHKIMLTQTSVGGKQCVRVAIGSRETEERHLKESWEGIIRPLIAKAREDVKVSFCLSFSI